MMGSTFTPLPLPEPQIPANFPQPTRPINSDNYKDVEVEPPPSSWGPEGRLPSQVNYSYAPSAATTMEDGEDDDRHQTREELQRAILELYNTLPASLRTRVTLDRFHVPSVRDVLQNLNLDLDPASTRGVYGTVDKLSRKIERFKVRTVQLGGVVKEEKDKKIQAT